MVISPIGRGGVRRPEHNLTQLAGRRGLFTALPDGGQRYTAPSAADRIRSSVPRDLRTPNKSGRCYVAVSLGWPARTNSRRDEFEAVT
jgi:hypothetical protein